MIWSLYIHRWELLFISFEQVYSKNFYNWVYSEYSGLCKVLSKLQITDFNASWLLSYIFMPASPRRRFEDGRGKQESRGVIRMMSNSFSWIYENIVKKFILERSCESYLKRKKFFSLRTMEEIEIKSKHRIKSIKIITVLFNSDYETYILIL